MSSAAYDVATILQNATLGTIGTDLFIGKDPGEKTQTVTLYDTGGPSPNPKWARDEKNIQIRIAGAVNDYAGAWTKAESIKSYLLGLAPQTVGTKIYILFTMLSDITHIGYDQNSRPLLTINLRVIIDLPNTGNRLTI